MRQLTFRLLFSAAEVTLGFALAAFGSYLIFVKPVCPPNSFDCPDRSQYGAMIFLVPGLLIAFIGCLSYFWERPSLPVVQVSLGASLSVYFMWLFGML